MKGSLVAMMAAAAAVTANDQTAPLWIVCTADEEIGFDGAKHLVKHSPSYREIVHAQPLAIIGEPTRLSVVHAHKGIYGFQITSHGRAAHSSTSEGINANEAMVPMLQTLLELGQRSRADSQYLDSRFDPPDLSWNFGFSDGGTAINITPEKSVAWVSLRPMPTIDGADLVEAAAHCARSLGLEFKQLEGGAAVWIDPDARCVRELCELTGSQPQTVCYGTDGGEFAELENRVVLGPGDIAQAHTTDEWIELDQLQRGIDLFTLAIRRWCAGSP
jgi:acetylornithine deacetylase